MRELKAEDFNWSLKESFDRLVKILRSVGYKVSFPSWNTYPERIANVTGRGIKAVFAEKCVFPLRIGQHDWAVDGRISADQVKNFDKVAKCQLRVEIPDNIDKTELLLQYLEILAEDKDANVPCEKETAETGQIPNGKIKKLFDLFNNIDESTTKYSYCTAEQILRERTDIASKLIALLVSEKKVKGELNNRLYTCFDGKYSSIFRYDL